MSHFAVALAWVLLLGGIFGCMAHLNDQATNGGLPLVHAAQPLCPSLPNPCDRVDCKRPNTKDIS